jgi:hypothetical protein
MGRCMKTHRIVRPREGGSLQAQSEAYRCDARHISDRALKINLPQFPPFTNPSENIFAHIQNRYLPIAH